MGRPYAPTSMLAWIRAARYIDGQCDGCDRHTHQPEWIGFRGSEDVASLAFQRLETFPQCLMHHTDDHKCQRVKLMHNCF